MAACSSAVGPLSAILRRIESILAVGRGILLGAPIAGMSNSPAAHAATAWHTDQRARLTTIRPSRPQMPADHRCAPGGCAEPPPPLPAGVEGFSVTPSSILIGLAAAAVIGLGLFVILAVRKRVKIITQD